MKRNLLRVKNLTIRAFRGVPREISLDFTAPLTFLYAPNGTGKTTVCDAAEWLLTGQVDRLSVRQSQREADMLRCKLAEEGAPTSVDGDLLQGDDEWHLQRRFGDWYVGTGLEAIDPAPTQDVLLRLAPSGAGTHTHHRAAQASRQTWLRGTRFLAGEALAVLLDPQRSEVREQVFADLLGVRHLLDMERRLDRYCASIRPRLNQLESECDEKGRDLGTVEADLTQLPDAADNRVLRAFNRLREAQSSLGSEPGVSPTIDVAALRDLSANVSAALAQREALLTAKKEAEAVVLSGWAERPVLLDEVTAGQKEQERIAVECQSRAVQIKKLSRGIEESRSRLAEMRDVHSRIEWLGAELPKVLNRVSASADGVTSTASSATLRELWNLAPFVQLPADERSRLADKVRALAAEASDRLAEAERVAALKRRHEAISATLGNAEALASVETEAADAERALAQASALHDQAAGLLQQLHRQAEKAITVLNQETRCPVCLHNWGSPEGLREALARALEAAPPSIAVLARNVQQAEARTSAARAKVEELRRLASEQHQIRTALAPLERRWQAYTIELSSVDVDASEGSIVEALDRQARLLALANSLAQLRAVLEQVSQILMQPIPEDLNMAEIRESVEGDLEKHGAGVVGETASGTTALHALVAQRDALQTQQDLDEKETEAVRKRTVGVAQRLRALADAWQTVAGDAQWDEKGLGIAQAHLRGEEQTLSEARGHLAACEEELVQAERHDKLWKLRQELRALSEQRDRVRALYVRAKAASEKTKIYRQDYVSRQIGGLQRVFFPLFARMQANEVFDDVRGGGTDAPLEWVAEAMGQTFGPGSEFSQGQRQDLAMAIFLARARGLGGTFFLDEPVIHLDDLNRVAMLDVFRALVVEEGSDLNLVVTTASHSLVRHMAEKFALVPWRDGVFGNTPPLRIVTLTGNPVAGVRVESQVDVGRS